jgi:hypothetical protein
LIDFPERPQDYSQPAHGDDSVFEDEPRGGMTIPLAVIDSDSLFKVRPRAGVIPLEPGSYSRDVQ